MAHMAAVTSQ